MSKKIVIGTAAALLALTATGTGAAVASSNDDDDRSTGDSRLDRTHRVVDIEGDREDRGHREDRGGRWEDRGNNRDDRGNNRDDRGGRWERGEHGDRTVTGPQADQATAAALGATGGGRANSVERDSENGATWEVEVTKTDGTTVDVRLDGAYRVVVIEGDREDNEGGFDR